MSWVTLDDVVGILRMAIEKAAVRGAVNVVAPQPVKNAEFTKVLAKALHRPALFPAPGFALRLALGEMADALLLSSQRVAPQRVELAGFRFAHADLTTALGAVLSAS
jgi:NAD dependent epimerase/dehydratase family enzyme